MKKLSALLLLTLVALGGCGQTGKLYLPPQTTTSAPASPVLPVAEPGAPDRTTSNQ